MRRTITAPVKTLTENTFRSMAWRKTFEGVQRRAEQLGVKLRTGEMAADFERRVLTAHQRAASAAQGAPA
jgi:predicted deacetylase